MLLSLLFCCSCKRNSLSYTFISKDEYYGYVNYDTTDWCEKCHAKSILIKNLSFNFDMEVPIDLSSIDYEFLIIREGVIYRGPFDNYIEVNNLSFCMDSNLSKVNTLAFILIDHTNKQVYKWYKKESYYLYKKDKYSISLKCNGDYSLR